MPSDGGLVAGALPAPAESASGVGESLGEIRAVGGPASGEAAREAWLRPSEFPPSVGAVMSTRAGGVSRGAFASLNLRPWVEAPGHDASEAVAQNQARFAAELEGAVPVWLDQVHGTRVLRLTHTEDAFHPHRHPPRYQADAAITTDTGLACTVLVADCLPVLFASECGRVVGAAHAGWRGLAGGVLEATAAAMQDSAGVVPSQIHAWLGACIGPTAFEVGADVREAFGPAAETFFQPHPAPKPGGPPKWLADLPGLARWRLAQAGLTQVQSCGACSYSEPSRFFSFRRDGVTGRHAAAIWRRG